MASTRYADDYTTRPARSGIRRDCDVRRLTLAAAIVVNDIFVMIPVQKGCCLVGGYIQVPELDTGADNMVSEVGIPADTDKFLAASTLGRAAGVTNFNLNLGYVFTEDTYIQLKCTTAPGTSATSGEILMFADLFFSQTS